MMACFSLGWMSTRLSLNWRMVVAPSALPAAPTRPFSIILKLVSGWSVTCTCRLGQGTRHQL